MAHSVSVVTPSYNQGRFIARTIESVLGQQFDGRLQYIVMDGGSGDETVEIVKRYGSRLEWVSEKDRGQAHAVNKGLARAAGEIIGWLNSDDIYYPGAIAAVCEVFAAHPDVDVVYGDARHIDIADGIIESYPTEDWNFERLLETCYLCQPAVFFRKRVVDRFGALNDRLHFCLDYEYWIRLAENGAKFFRLRQELAGSRLYPETKTMGSRVRFHVEINDMLRSHTGRVPDSWLFNYAHAVLDEKGVPRTDGVRFRMLVAALSLSAAVRWNRRISRAMAKTAGIWSGGAIRELYQRKLHA